MTGPDGGGDAGWREIGDRVFVRRHREYDLNVGLVVGDDACLVVDTRSSEAQGRELAAAVRRVSRRPWVVVDTHAHFDHYFGNAAFRPAAVWGHRRCAAAISAGGAAARAELAAEHRRAGRPDAAAHVLASRLDPPGHLVDDAASVDLGGRSVALRHLGRGHTDADLVVLVPDAGVLFAGDLVEEGAPPSFEDSFPLDWPETLAALLPLAAGPVVPGHGAVVDAGYVERQRAELAAVAAVARQVAAGQRPAAAALGALPFPGPAGRQALRRALAQLPAGPPR